MMDCMTGRMMGSMIRYIFLFMFALVMPALATNQDSKLKQLEQQLLEQQNQEQTLSAQEQQEQAAYQKLQQSLIASAQRESTISQKEQALQASLSQLAQTLAEQRRAFNDQQGELAELLVALSRLARLPPEAMLLQNRAPIDMVRGAQLLRAQMPALIERANAYAEMIAALNANEQQQIAEQEQLIATRQELLQQRGEIADLLAIRKARLEKTKTQRQLLAENIATITRNAKDMRGLVDKLAQLATPLPEATDGFTLPANGKVKLAFGAADDVGNHSPGITMALPANSLLRAPAAGRVMFAGLFKGYGQILIIEHRGGYHSLLAGFGTIDAEVGQNVAGGEPLGKARQNSTMVDIYFELRQNGEPVNPLTTKGKNT